METSYRDNEMNAIIIKVLQTVLQEREFSGKLTTRWGGGVGGVESSV